MERKRGVPVHWGMLLIVYLAILFATTMVALTSGSSREFLVLLLATGIPIYFVASRAILREDAATRRTILEVVANPPQDPGVIPFPSRVGAEAAADLAQAAGAHAPRIRKLR